VRLSFEKISLFFVFINRFGQDNSDHSFVRTYPGANNEPGLYVFSYCTLIYVAQLAGGINEMGASL
jgi:hypothetical protein